MVSASLLNIGAFERFLLESTDAWKPEQASMVADKMFSHIESIYGDPSGFVWSFDVFDTVLLRDDVGEKERFYECGKLFQVYFKEKGFDFRVEDIFAARIGSHYLAYRTTCHSDGVPEASIYTIFTGMLKLLGVPDHFLRDLIDIELNFETRRLRLNPFLKEFLGRLDIKTPILLISDMYLAHEHILCLLKSANALDQVYKLYVSCDYKNSKRNKTLYRTVLKKEDLASDAVFHVGDNFKSDVANAKANGLNALHLPIPTSEQVKRSAAQQKFLKYFRERYEVDIFNWFKNRPPDKRSSKEANVQLSNAEKRVKWAREVLGPIFYDFIDKSHLALMQRAEEQPSTALFCTRAGIRLFQLYEHYKNRRGLIDEKNLEVKHFQVSRFLVAKACFERVREATFDLLYREFRHYLFGDMALSILPEELALKYKRMDIQKQFHDLFDKPIEPWMLDRLFKEETEIGRDLAAHFLSESRLYRKYLIDLLGNRAPILIDTGWQATQQLLLQKGFPEYDWFGVYFGRIHDKETDRSHFTNVLGICVDSGGYDSNKMQSIITLYHHIIEDALEPAMASCERLATEKEFKKSLKMAKKLKNDDDHFRGIWEYFNQAVEYSVVKTRRDAVVAWEKLEQIIGQPVYEDVLRASTRPRSADFGKDEKNKVVFFYPEKGAATQRDRMKRSLWKGGQFALEFEGIDLRSKQQQWLKSVDQNKGSIQVPKGKVSIITRTKNRPALLKRAAKSVANQTYSNYQWVVVNDVGDRDCVEEVIKNSAVDLAKTVILHRVSSTGMESASNAGISISEPSDYIVIHDDDDSWHADFLKEAVTFLDNPPTPFHRGVVTKTLKMDEIIVNDKYAEIVGSEIYNPWLNSIQLMTMLIGNTFAPIAFLFSREIYDQLEGYNEKLPVLGDWDFNLRFLNVSEIGFIDKPLANYHHRDATVSNEYANSLSDGVDKHQLYDTAIRNDSFRSAPLFADMGSQETLLSIALGAQTRDIRHHIDFRSESDVGDHNSPSSLSGGDIYAKLQAMQDDFNEKLAQHEKVTNRLLLQQNLPISKMFGGMQSMNFEYSNARFKEIYESAHYCYADYVLEGLSFEGSSYDWIDFKLILEGSMSVILMKNYHQNLSFLRAIFPCIAGDTDIRLTPKYFGALLSDAEDRSVYKKCANFLYMLHEISHNIVNGDGLSMFHYGAKWNDFFTVFFDKLSKR